MLQKKKWVVKSININKTNTIKFKKYIILIKF